MTYYSFDRRFTDYIHTNLAIRQIYNVLDWEQSDVSLEELNKLDLNDGIDYMFVDKYNNNISVQERFREVKYKKYNDFTIRYRREYSQFKDRKESEFVKIKADYFVYGITNGYKSELKTNTRFEKYAVIDLFVIYELINSEKIKIDKSSKISYISDGVFYAGYNKNRDFSSDFIVFDIQKLYDQFKDLNIILIQYGFY